MRSKFALIMFGLAMAVGMGPAAAQNSLVSPKVMDAVSANGIVSIFSEVEMTGSVVGASGGDQLVQLVSEDGFVMYVALSNCASQAATAPCSIVKPYAIFEGSGFTFEAVNGFNFSVSNVSTLMIMPDGRGLLGVKLLLTGGVTPENFTTYLGNFMFDAAALLGEAEESAATSVSYESPQGLGPKPGTIPAASARMNAFGASTAGTERAALALGGERIKIRN
ncbi:hypothetical protein [Hyphococcus sp.]|uniref:hypothetical protein n=1 Tax=Hyphococcus sp. TaxID=2038636 RepID=UPI00207EEE13|nr:MAG: hypothetical protein DHS20C04_07970 [Marinicaulis sp.]